MIITHRFSFVICIVLTLATVSLGWAAGDQMVTATGMYPMEEISRDTARDRALASAFRNAVEKGLGVWIKSETEVQDNMVVRDEMLSRAEGYVTEHEIVKEGVQDGFYTVIISAMVSVDKIGADFRALVGRVKTQMDNPSITFVLTTWEKPGRKTSFEQTESGKETRSGSHMQIDENVWKKYPDLTIIDAFQQEFKEKGFDLKASDKAREIALTESLAKTAIDIKDRAAVRDAAEKEGANFVGRGEVMIIDASRSEATGNEEVTAKLGMEVIDVNSGDVVAAYSNTATASSRSVEVGKAQAIKKVAVLGARTLAEQTIATWQDRSLSGREYTIEIRNMTSIRKQKLPLIKAVQSLAKVKSQTSPKRNSLLLTVLFKGDKNSLGTRILEIIGDKPGFSESEFDGPMDEGGRIVFVFLKK